MKEKIKIDEATALKELGQSFKNAEDILQDTDKLEELLQRLENKLKVIPHIGDKLAVAASMASMVKSFAKKEYTQVPIGSVVAAISAIVYVVSPIDLIPDTIPGIGYIDDAAVIAACLKLIESDLTEYIEWRKENGKELDV